MEQKKEETLAKQLAAKQKKDNDVLKQCARVTLLKRKAHVLHEDDVELNIGVAEGMDEGAEDIGEGAENMGEDEDIGA